MPTAIVRLLTTKGFVLAADGLVRCAGSVLKLDQQKIFPVPGKPLAYAVCGNPGVTQGSENTLVVDLVFAAKMATEAIVGHRVANFFEYARRLSEPLYDHLVEAKIKHPEMRYPSSVPA